MKIFPQRKIGINLTGETKALFGKVFIGWSINSGRVIIVATELIALGALLFRFIIDRNIINLQGEIEQQEKTLKDLKDEEATYRLIQAKLQYVKPLTSYTNTTVKAYQYFLDEISTDAFEIEQIGLKKTELSIEGAAASVFVLDELTKRLKKYDEIESLSLNKVETDQSKVEFTIKAKLKVQEPGILKDEFTPKPQPENPSAEEEIKT